MTKKILSGLIISRTERGNILSVKFTSHAPEVLDGMKAAAARALETCGGVAEGHAKRACPVGTGNLRNSITHQQQDEKTELIGSNVSYAPFVELGHHQEPGRFVPKLKKRLVKSYVQGHPFLRPAVENHRAEYRAIIDAEMRR